MPDPITPKTAIQIMQEPSVTYRVLGVVAGEELQEPYDTEVEARDAADMIRGGGGEDVRIERVTLRVVEEREET